MHNYDKTKVGKLISFGSDHLVYNYGEKDVIKFSLLDRFFPKYVRPRMKSDLLLSNKFFGKYILDTHFLSSTNKKWLAKVQQKIVGHFLKKQDLKDLIIRTQFLEIISNQNSLIHDEHSPLDLIGKKGVLSGYFSNILITDSNELLIIDTTMLSTKDSGVLGLFLVPIAFFAKWRQKNIIRNYKKYCNEF